LHEPGGARAGGWHPARRLLARPRAPVRPWAPVRPGWCYPGTRRRRGRRQTAGPGGRATARTIPSAVSAASAPWLEWSPARFTTTPVTGPVAPVAVPVPMFVPAVLVAAEPDEEEPFLPDPPPLALEPVATAFPFFTTQCSGAPRFWQGDGNGAVASRMLWPFCMVGLWQLRSWGNLRLTLPGILAFWTSPPWTRFLGSGEYPSCCICCWPPQSMKLTNVLSVLPFAVVKLVGRVVPDRGTIR